MLGLLVAWSPDITLGQIMQVVALLVGAAVGYARLTARLAVLETKVDLLMRAAERRWGVLR